MAPAMKPANADRRFPAIEWRHQPSRRSSKLTWLDFLRVGAAICAATADACSWYDCAGQTSYRRTRRSRLI